MTTGSYTIGNSNTPLFATKTWSGADDPAHKAWNEYTMTAFRKIREPANRYRTLTGAYVDSPLAYDATQWYPWTSSFSDNDQIALMGNVLTRIRSHDFNAAVFGAELSQTVGMVGDRVRSVLQGFRYALMGQYGKALKMLAIKRPKAQRKFKDVSDFVLETRYGWLPLLGDIYEAMKAVHAMTTNARSVEFTERRTVRVTQDASPSTSIYQVPSVGTFTRSYTVRFTEQMSVARSLGLLNPASVLWEKLPWSFVFDWFIPIGDYLSVLAEVPNLKGTLYRTDFARATGRKAGPPKWGSYYTYVGGDVSYTAVRIQRYAATTLSKVAVPFPSLKALDKAFSLTHIQNAAALVWSGLARVHR